MMIMAQKWEYYWFMWFFFYMQRVKEYSKSHFLKVFNHNNQTADELFASNYCELHEETKE